MCWTPYITSAVSVFNLQSLWFFDRLESPSVKLLGIISVISVGILLTGMKLHEVYFRSEIVES